jgi:hypothetical protein
MRPIYSARFFLVLISLTLVFEYTELSACADESQVTIGGTPVFAVGETSAGAGDVSVLKIQHNIDNSLIASSDRSPSAVKISYVNGLPVISLGGYYIVTIDSNTAKNAGCSPSLLAAKWSNALRAALENKESIDAYVAQLSGKNPAITKTANAALPANGSSDTASSGIAPSIAGLSAPLPPVIAPSIVSPSAHESLSEASPALSGDMAPIAAMPLHSAMPPIASMANPASSKDLPSIASMPAPASSNEMPPIASTPNTTSAAPSIGTMSSPLVSSASPANDSERIAEMPTTAPDLKSISDSDSKPPLGWQAMPRRTPSNSNATVASPTQAMYQGHASYVPAGMIIPVRLATSISSSAARPGDVIMANTTAPIDLGSGILPADSLLIGTVTESSPGSRLAHSGSLSLKFTSLRTPNGIETPISAHISGSIGKYEDKGNNDTFYGETGFSKVKDSLLATVIGAGAGSALGLAVGSIAGGSRGLGAGAWSGAAIGGAAGLAESLLLRKGHEINLQQGEQLNLQLDAAANLAMN